MTRMGGSFRLGQLLVQRQSIVCSLSNGLCMGRDWMSVWSWMGTQKHVMVPARIVRGSGVVGIRSLLTPHPATFSAIGCASCTLDYWSSLRSVVFPSSCHCMPLLSSSACDRWKGGGRGSGGPLARVFASSKPLPIPPTCVPYLLGARP